MELLGVSEMEKGIYNLATLGGRLGYIVAKVGKRNVLKSVNISEAQLNKYIGGRTNKHTLEPLLEICANYGYRIEWLAVGSGEKETSEYVNSSVVLHDLPSAPLPSDYQSVILNPTYLKNELLVDPKQCIFCVAEGDSMIPTISPGDMLLVDQSRKRGDGIFKFSIDATEMIKRLQFLPENQVKIVSDNSKYESYQLSADKLEIVGRVVWHGGRV